MIVWRGWGFLPLLLMIIISALVELIKDYLLAVQNGTNHYRYTHDWVLALAMALTGVACWFLGRWFENRELRKAQVLINKETGQYIRLVSRHDLFWIPIKWWSPVFLQSRFLCF